MSVKLKGTQSRRTTSSEYNISQWTQKQANLNLYKRMNDNGNPDMMGSDNLLFDPKEMIAGSANNAAPTAYDKPSLVIEKLRMEPTYMTIGAFVLFLFVLRYLRS